MWVVVRLLARHNQFLLLARFYYGIVEMLMRHFAYISGEFHLPLASCGPNSWPKVPPKMPYPSR